ncbi:MAG TPA: prepilin-type N-terminal cleavage/methylation domain-containing protein [Stellaceae bacterium]|nr:prepilin-type N-terminal cleavage/methylation domain-containing protein [Stellaceae bacterium]
MVRRSIGIDIPDREPRRSGGFTLIEVVVAVAIAGLALVALFRAGTGGLVAADAAGRVDQAIERAQSHLAAFGRSGALVPGEVEGEDGGGYRFQMRAVPLATQQSLLGGQNAAATTLYDVEVLISWQAGGRTRSTSLRSRRIGPGAPPQ